MNGIEKRDPNDRDSPQHNKWVKAARVDGKVPHVCNANKADKLYANSLWLDVDEHSLL
jgi:hypothetical protein